jgi:hypothetical protein
MNGSLLLLISGRRGGSRLGQSGQKLGPDIVAAVQSGSGSTIVERLVVTIFRDLALRSDLHPARA